MTSPSPLAIPNSVQRANRTFLDARRQLAAHIVCARSGLDTAERLTVITDRWLNQLWATALPRKLAHHISLYATGGYGRRELAYHSDVDVLIAVHEPDMVEDDQFALSMERLMAWSRHTRVRLSHAVRTSRQARCAIDDDLRSAIALIDLRHLAGPDRAHRHFRRAPLIEYLRGDDEGRAFVERLIDGLRRRLSHHGKTVFLLEPDIKNGEGGLRDLNCIHWAAQVRWQLDARHQSKNPIGWTAARRHAYTQYLDELLAIRNQLHLLHDRKQDRLTFRDQEALATLVDSPVPDDAQEALDLAGNALAIADAAEHTKDRFALQPIIEEEMTHYYRRARSIATTCERCLRQWATAANPPAKTRGPFHIGGGQLALARGHELDDDDLFDALLVAEAEDLLLDPRLEATIEYRLRAWPRGDDLPSERARKLCQILVDPDASPRTSQRLLELGILPRVVPEFEPLLCHVHHDLYHVYTTDVHSIKCLEAARQLLGSEPDAHPRPAFARIAAEIEDRTTFLLAALFHDIGKNRGGEHSRRGAEIMACVGPRLGLDAAGTHRLQHLVLHHLLLSNTSRRRDISDPHILAELVDRIDDLEFLNQLTALTYCDMSTVGPDVMDDWNASLLLQLHQRLRQRLLAKAPASMPVAPSADEDRRSYHHQRVGNALDDTQPPAQLKAFIDGLPLEHLENSDEQSLLRQYVTYCDALDSPNDFAVSAQPLADRSVTELIVTGPDEPGILARIAGAIASVGLNIMSADIISTSDGFAVDIFHVAHFNPRAVPPISPRAVDSPRRLDGLRQRIMDVLCHDVDIDELLERRRTEQRLAPRPVPAVSTRVRVDPHTSRRFTVLEVRAPDQLGLLYTIASTLFQCRVNTRVSRIDSLGHQAIDTFYVEDFDGRPLTQTRIAEVTASLQDALANFLS